MGPPKYGVSRIFVPLRVSAFWSPGGCSFRLNIGTEIKKFSIVYDSKILLVGYHGGTKG